jgi:hypothetical protein
MADEKMTDLQLVGKIERCVNSAAASFRYRMPKGSINYNALDDIESDLKSGLEAAKELFRRRNQ